MDIANFSDLLISFRTANALYADADSFFDLNLCPEDLYGRLECAQYSFCDYITLPGIPTEGENSGYKFVIRRLEGEAGAEFERLANFGGAFLPLAVKDVLRPCKPTSPFGWWIAFLFWDIEMREMVRGGFTDGLAASIFLSPFEQSQDAIERCDLTKSVGKLPSGLRLKYPGFTYEIEANRDANTDADTEDFYVTTTQLNGLLISPKLKALKAKYPKINFNPIKGKNGQGDMFNYLNVRSIIIALDEPSLKERLPESVSKAREMVEKRERSKVSIQDATPPNLA